MIAMYTRVSTQEQAREGYSIEEQASRLRSYCNAMGWPDHKLYTDPGYSGGSTDRPALQQLIRDVEAGGISRVVVYKLDRLSRSQLDTLYLIERVFLAHSCEFVSISESFDTGTPFGRAMVGILAVFAQLEREQIRERMTMGREARAKEGKYFGGGPAPVGYEYQNGLLHVVPDEAIIIREIYSRFIAGDPIHEIAIDLDRRGIRHKHGPWEGKRVMKVLSSPLYIGKVAFNKKQYEGLHQPIVDMETWQAAQERLAVRRELTKKYAQVSGKHSLLTGLIWCARCGARYRGSGAAQKYRYYICYSRRKSSSYMVRDPSCMNRSWRQERLDDLILGEIAKLSVDPSAIPEVSSRPHPEEQIAALESTLADVRRRKGRLLDLYATQTALTPDELSARINPLAERETRLQAEIETLRATAGMEEQQAVKLVSSFADVIARGVYSEIRALIEALIDRIELDGDTVTIHWRF